jgi:hypothetical protein
MVLGPLQGSWECPRRLITDDGRSVTDPRLCHCPLLSKEISTPAIHEASSRRSLLADSMLAARPC